MNKEQLTSLLNELGLNFSQKGKILLNGKAITDEIADALLTAKGSSLQAVRQTIAEIKRQKINEIAGDLRMKDTISRSEVLAPALEKEAKWNNKDDELFQFFYIARASGGAGLMLVVSNNQGDCQAVPIDSNRLDMLADITTACSALYYTDPETNVKRTLYDYINHKMDAIMAEALTVFKKTDSKDFGVWAANGGLPSMMINNYKLVAMQEAKEITNPDKTKVTMYDALALSYPESPLQCIANHYDTLAGVPGRIKPIPKIYSNNPDELAFYHIDLAQIIDTEAKCPTWDKFMLRFTPNEGKVIKAYVWSIFVANNNGRQMLYIYDAGGFSGKSVLMGCITEVLGTRLVAALQKDSLNNQFSMDKVWNKILCIIDDNKNKYLLRGEKMHQLLGSGVADIEPKGKRSFSHRLHCKVIASGNTRLVIDPDANHERTRVIVVEPKLSDEMLKEFVVLDENGNIKRDRRGNPQFIGDTSFEVKLKEEFKAFLYQCKEAYAELCPTNSSIILPDEMIDSIYNMSDDSVDVLDETINKSFIFDPKYRISVTDFKKLVDTIVESMNANDAKSAMTYDDVKTHMEKKYKIKKSTCRIDGDVTKCYVGIKSAGRKNVSLAVMRQTADLPDINESEIFGEAV